MKFINAFEDFFLKYFVFFLLALLSCIQLHSLVSSNNYESGFLSFYYGALLVILTEVYWSTIDAQGANANSLSESALWKKVLFYLVLIFVISIVLLAWNSYPLWLDEYFQYQSSVSSNNFIESAAIHQQPPGSLAFSFLFLKILGENFDAMKLTSYVPYVFLAIFGGLWIYRKINCMSAILFLLTISLIYPFSQSALNGRSLSLAMLWAFIVFTLIYSIIEMETTSLNRKNFIQLVIATFFFLNSLGLQPLALVLLAGVSSILFHYLFYKEEKKFLHIGVALLVASLMFLPLQGYLKFKAGELGFMRHVTLGSLISSFKDLELKKLLDFYIPFKGYIGAIAILINLITLILILVKKRNKWLNWASFVVIIFPVIFYFGYTSLFYWKLLPRYYFIWTFIYFVFFFVFIPHLFSNKYSRIFTGLMVLFLIVQGTLPKHIITQHEEENAWKDDWAKIYKEIKQQRHEDTMFFISSACTEGTFCEKSPLFMEFYALDAVTRNRIITKDHLGLMEDAAPFFLKQFPDLKVKLALIIPRFFSLSAYQFLQELSKDPHLYPYIEILIEKDFVMLKSKGPLPVKEGMSKFLTNILKLTGSNPNFHTIRRTHELISTDISR